MAQPLSSWRTPWKTWQTATIKDLGQHEHALALYQRVLTIYEREQPHDVETADVLEVMADVLDDLGQSAQAEELRARGQAILDRQDR